MPTVDELLDLAPGIGQRQASYQFQLVDGASGRPLGDIHPSELSPPSLAHDTTRTVTRTLTGLQLTVEDTAAVNALRDRVRVSMIIGGSIAPLGTYVFTDSTRTRTTGGRRASNGLADLGFVVAEPTDTTVSYNTGTNIGVAIAALLNSIDGLQGVVIEPTVVTLGTPIAWPAGTDRGRILSDLCKLGAYLLPYMGNDSQIYVRQSFDPATVPATFTLDEGGRVLHGSIAETDDLLIAPNRFIVIDSGNTGPNGIVGRYDIPVSAPHSIANRGFVVAKVQEIQGLGTVVTADASAKAIGLADTLFQRVSLGTTPDPRHDSYDIIKYDGVNWLETAWSLPLHEGSEMVHSIQRAYT